MSLSCQLYRDVDEGDSSPRLLGNPPARSSPSSHPLLLFSCRISGRILVADDDGTCIYHLEVSLPSPAGYLELTSIGL